MYFQLLRWECISYHIMQCAADTPTVSVGIIMQCAANTPTVSVGIINWLRRWSALLALNYCRFSTTQILQRTVKKPFRSATDTVGLSVPRFRHKGCHRRRPRLRRFLFWGVLRRRRLRLRLLANLAAWISRWGSNKAAGPGTGRGGEHWQGRRGKGGGGRVARRQRGPPGPMGGGARIGPPSGRDLQRKGRGACGPGRAAGLPAASLKGERAGRGNWRMQ